MNLWSLLLGRRWFSHLLLLTIIFIGAMSVWQMPMAEKPAIDLGQVSITTSFPGASSLEVESNVTSKLEKELLSVAGIERFTSRSETGASSISIRIDPGVSDMNEVYQDIRDAVNRVTDLPIEVTERPLVRISKSSNLDFMVVGIGSELPYATLREQARILELKLRRVSGVGEVNLIDLRRREFWVELQPEQLRRYQLTINDVISEIEARNVLVTSGAIDGPEGQLELVTDAQLLETQQLMELVIRNQPEVRLKDVAAVVRMGFERGESLATINGMRSIGFDLRAAEKADVIATSKSVRALLNEEQSRLGDDYRLSVGFDIANEIQARFDMVKVNGVTGLALVMLVLALCLNRRVAPWVALSIPFCVLGTLAVLSGLGQVLDSYTMAALILVIGVVVDDAVVVSERISAEYQQGTPLGTAIIDGTKQVMPAIVVSILTTIIAFVPLLVLPGQMGKLLYVLPLTIAIALSFSLIDALLIVPAHMRKAMKKVQPSQSSYLEKLGQVLGPWIAQAIKAPRKWMATALLIAITTIGVLSLRLPLLFFPTDGAYLVAITAPLPANLDLEQAWKHAQQVDAMLAETPEVVGWYGEVSEEEGSWEVSLSPAGKRKMTASELVQQWQQRSGDFGYELEFDVDSGGAPGSRPIDVRVVGGSDSDRQQLADELETWLKAYPGAVAPRQSQSEPVAQLTAKMDHQWMSRLQVDTSTLARTLRAAIEGERVSRLFVDDEEVRYRVVLENDDRNIDELNHLLVRNRSGELVSMHRVLSWQHGERAANIDHYNGLRSIRVSSHVDAKLTDPVRLEQDLSAAFANHGYSSDLVMAGQAEETRDALYGMAFAMTLTVAAILVVMLILFDRMGPALVALQVIPVAVAAALLVLWLHGKPLSFFACVGILGMVGVVINNALVLLHHYQTFAFSHEPEVRLQQLLEGALSRVRPMLVTTLTTVAGLLPLAYGLGGYDNLMSPIALVIGWGMLLSAPMVLLLVPAGYGLLLSRNANSEVDSSCEVETLREAS